MNQAQLNKYFEAFSPEQWEMRKLALSSLYNFNKYILGYQKMTDEVHKTWEDFLRRNEGPGKYKLILIPRGHFKTTFFTVGAPIWLLLQNPEMRILLVNAKWDNARSFLWEMRQQIDGNEMLHWVFPETRSWVELSSKWTNDAIVIPRKRKMKEASISTTGVGAHVVSQHYDLIIGDDLVDNENTQTRDQIEKTVNWWKQSLSLMDDPVTSQYWLIGTRWHDADLYGWILGNIPEEFDVIKKSAYREDGTPYFPELFSAESLEKIKKKQGTYIFSCQYLNDPVDEENAIFHRDWILSAGYPVKLKYDSAINYYQTCLYAPNATKDGFDERKLDVYVAIDPAIGEKEYNDYTAVVAIGIDQETGMTYVLDIFHDRVNPKGQIDALFNFNRKWHPMCIAVETIAYQKALKFWLDNYSIKEHIYAPFVETKTDWSKIRRIQMIQPIFEARGVVVLESCPHKEDLYYELLRFPKGEHDDIIDAVEICFRQAGIIYRDKPIESQFSSELEQRIAARLDRASKGQPVGYVDTILGTDY